MVGNPVLVAALTRMKSYLDYGMFTPIQIAAIAALTSLQECVQEVICIRAIVMCGGLSAIGWKIEKPKATMFVCASIADAFMEMGSLEFSK